MNLIKNLENIQSDKNILLCFPYAGGGASIYSNWIKKLQNDVTVCSIQLPGREDRIIEAPYTHMKELLKELNNQIIQLKNNKIFIFGHSMGAKIAYEAAKILEYHNITVNHLIVSGSRVPHIPETNPISHLSDKKFKNKIASFGVTPKEIIQNEDLFNFFLPMLRADFILDETYYNDKIEMLSCPITSFYGKEDQDANYETISKWKEYTKSNFDYETFEGGHFFLKNQEEKVLSKITKILKSS